MTPNTQTPKAAPNATRAAQATKTEKPAKVAPTPKVDPVLSKKIFLLTDKGSNPKRVGTASHVRFAHYKNGMTVAAYLEACGADNRRAARADIAWDGDHKYIELRD